jgi:hypothetical protein
MRYFVVIDLPDEVYPTTDPYYSKSGLDPDGRSSLAGWIESVLITDREDGRRYRPTDVTVYSDLNNLLADRREGLDMFAPVRGE